MAPASIAVPADPKRDARARAAIEAHEIHQAVCRYRRQGLACSTCSDLSERVVRGERLLGLDVVKVPAAEDLVIADGIVSWYRHAA